MNATGPGSTIDLTTISRTLAGVAFGVARSVERAMIGEARVRTARGNAWEAVCADRDRARRREEIRRAVAVLMAEPVGQRSGAPAGGPGAPVHPAKPTTRPLTAATRSTSATATRSTSGAATRSTSAGARSGTGRVRSGAAATRAATVPGRSVR